MTKQDILEYFKDINHAYNDCTRYDTLKRMIDELQEPCTNAISRQAVLERAINAPIAKVVTEDKVIYRKIIFADDVEKLPPVTPVEKVGHWIKIIGENGVTSAVRCSECGFEDNRYMLFRYCPTCGTKMEEVEE